MINHEYKLNMELKPISFSKALEIVKKQHHSDSIPRTSNICLGVYVENKLEGAITLGHGTRPAHTIKKMFPSLSTNDYLEIGRMCINDEFKTNTESQMLSKTITYVKKNYPKIKLIFTWSNGLLGKIGTVYQASNFLYGGFIKTECYIKDGIQMHPRGIKKWLHPNDSRKSVRPTPDEMKKYNIEHIEGKQFRYVYFLCGFSQKKKLIEESPFEWSLNYPKMEDCTWRKWVAPRKWVECEKPDIFTDDTKKYCRDKELTFKDLIENE